MRSPHLPWNQNPIQVRQFSALNWSRKIDRRVPAAADPVCQFSALNCASPRVEKGAGTTPWPDDPRRRRQRPFHHNASAGLPPAEVLLGNRKSTVLKNHLSYGRNAL
jgi:hypothetical protein